MGHDGNELAVHVHHCGIDRVGSRPNNHTFTQTRRRHDRISTKNPRRTLRKGRDRRRGVPAAIRPVGTLIKTDDGTQSPRISAHMRGMDDTYPGDVESWRYRCRGQTAVKHATKSPQAKWGLGLQPTDPETGRLGGSWVTAGGKRWLLLRGRASLIRMKSLVQIQVGPPPKPLAPQGSFAIENVLILR
jgi:hypothetical protein